MSARVESTAPQVDIAVLKVSSIDKTQPVLTLSSTGNARIGQEVFAIGTALGMLQNTLTRGIISGIRQTPGATLLQTDAAVNPGNSGGPLIGSRPDACSASSPWVTPSGRASISRWRSITRGRCSKDGPSAAVAAAPSARHDAGSVAEPSSETDQARSQGVRMYEQAIAQLARRADSLDNAWRQIRTGCYKGRASGGLDRAWFAVFNGRSAAGDVAPGCDRWFADFSRQAAEVAAGVIAAEEMARQADVYPGVRRDARRRYRLDYPGWER